MKLRKMAGLPPGQRELDEFPRFGVHFSQPAPVVDDRKIVRIGGPAATEPFVLRVEEALSVHRVDHVADFHCVAGWTFRGLTWGGVPMRAFYETVIVPRARPHQPVRWLRFTGADGYSSVLMLEDALADDVLLADRLNSEPLSDDHGAPLRLVSPSQYGYKSVKHLVSIELFAEEPADGHKQWLRRVLLALVRPHARARVWHEERRRHVPPWLLRALYRALIRPFARMSRRVP
ncbi:MAG TPA: molybdopterin-dependent oxidoreductase [Polyangia bacterium]|nr:molybdopterin-dependent oxidoreductase [Polyangia bacterium]